MEGYKVFKSGNSYEIYVYERVSDSLLKNDSVSAKVNESTIEKIKNELEGKLQENEVCAQNINFKDKRRMQTMRENRMHLKRMAKEYFSTGKVFLLTLTYADDVFADSIEVSEEHVKYFWKKLRRKFGNTSYLGVRELQKNGKIHYHFLVKNEAIAKAYENIPLAKKRGNRRISSEQQKEYERYFAGEFWEYGYVTLYELDNVDNVGAYITKYMTKGDIEKMRWLENRKMYLKSTDIKKVEALDPIQHSELIKSIVQQIPYFKSIAYEDIEFNLPRKRVFTNSYESEYVGKVTYYDVNIDRF